jgi:hypothetical protein
VNLIILNDTKYEMDWYWINLKGEKIYQGPINPQSTLKIGIWAGSQILVINKVNGSQSNYTVTKNETQTLQIKEYLRTFNNKSK